MDKRKSRRRIIDSSVVSVARRAQSNTRNVTMDSRTSSDSDTVAENKDVKTRTHVSVNDSLECHVGIASECKSGEKIHVEEENSSSSTQSGTEINVDCSERQTHQMEKDVNIEETGCVGEDKMQTLPAELKLVKRNPLFNELDNTQTTLIDAKTDADSKEGKPERTGAVTITDSDIDELFDCLDEDSVLSSPRFDDEPPLPDNSGSRVGFTERQRLNEGAPNSNTNNQTIDVLDSDSKKMYQHHKRNTKADICVTVLKRYKTCNELGNISPLAKRQDIDSANDDKTNRNTCLNSDYKDQENTDCTGEPESMQNRCPNEPLPDSVCESPLDLELFDNQPAKLHQLFGNDDVVSSITATTPLSVVTVDSTETIRCCKSPTTFFGHDSEAVQKTQNGYTYTNYNKMDPHRNNNTIHKEPGNTVNVRKITDIDPFSVELELTKTRDLKSPECERSGRGFTGLLGNGRSRYSDSPGVEMLTMPVDGWGEHVS